MRYNTHCLFNSLNMSSESSTNKCSPKAICGDCFLKRFSDQCQARCEEPSDGEVPTVSDSLSRVAINKAVQTYEFMLDS